MNNCGGCGRPLTRAGRCIEAYHDADLTTTFDALQARMQAMGTALESIGDEPKDLDELSQWDHADVYRRLAEVAKMAREALEKARQP